MKRILLIALVAVLCSCKKEYAEPKKERITPAPDRIIEKPVLQSNN